MLIRTVVVSTACLLLLGATFITGMLLHRPTTLPRQRIGPGDLAPYHVSQFPLQAGQAIASRYAQQCLNARGSGDAARRTALTTMVSDGLDPDCGWNGRGRLYASQVAWTGQTDPMAGQPHAAYFHEYLYLNGRGSPLQLVIPVYIADLATGTGALIDGVAGLMPPTAGPATTDTITGAASSGDSDDNLAASLRSDLLPGFLTAWAGSNSTDLARYRTPAASATVQTGMHGVLSQPRLGDVFVPTPPGSSDLGHPYQWAPNEAATAYVTVDWTIGTTGAQLLVGYRITMIHTTATATGWAVQDIKGGIPAAALSSPEDSANQSGGPVSVPTPSTTPSSPSPTPTPTRPPPSTTPPPARSRASSLTSSPARSAPPSRNPPGPSHPSTGTGTKGHHS